MLQLQKPQDSSVLKASGSKTEGAKRFLTQRENCRCIRTYKHIEIKTDSGFQESPCLRRLSYRNQIGSPSCFQGISILGTRQLVHQVVLVCCCAAVLRSCRYVPAERSIRVWPVYPLPHSVLAIEIEACITGSASSSPWLFIYNFMSLK
ncbi:hypothetical protein V6N12_005128 [Hibiscus sabdariffa]|uniref:Uncharacterized protein n=1 Tax=Hibiscus sabdariffa TaxID=183260 RepID=A0ABR2CNJ8_9ROSI